MIYSSTDLIQTQTKVLPLVSLTQTAKFTQRPSLTKDVLSSTREITNTLYRTTKVETTDVFNSKDFSSTFNKENKITNSFQSSTYLNIIPTKSKKSQHEQSSLHYTSSVSYKTAEKYFSKTLSLNTNIYTNTHVLYPGNIVSSGVSFNLFSSIYSTSRQVDTVSSAHQDNASLSLITQALTYIKSDSSSIKASISVGNNEGSSYYTSMAMASSSTIMHDHHTSLCSTINDQSPHSEHFPGSVVLQSATSEQKSRTIDEESNQPMLPVTQKFSTNNVNTRISNLIVSSSSPHHITIYSSSFKAKFPSKKITTTVFVVPRRTSSTRSPILSTSVNVQSTGIWM